MVYKSYNPKISTFLAKNIIAYSPDNYKSPLANNGISLNGPYYISLISNGMCGTKCYSTLKTNFCSNIVEKKVLRDLMSIYRRFK